jgi:hypothetical protein
VKVGCPWLDHCVVGVGAGWQLHRALPAHCSLLQPTCQIWTSRPTSYPRFCASCRNRSAGATQGEQGGIEMHNRKEAGRFVAPLISTSSQGPHLPQKTSPAAVFYCSCVPANAPCICLPLLNSSIPPTQKMSTPPLALTPGLLPTRPPCTLLPAPPSRSYITRYVQSGEPHILNSQRSLVGLDKNHTIFPINLIAVKLSGTGQVRFAPIGQEAQRRSGVTTQSAAQSRCPCNGSNHQRGAPACGASWWGHSGGS